MQLVNKNDPPRPRPMEQRRCRATGLAVSMAGRRLRADTPTRRWSAPRAGDAGPFPGPFLLLCICASRSHTVSCFCYKQATRGVGGGTRSQPQCATPEHSAPCYLDAVQLHHGPVLPVAHHRRLHHLPESHLLEHGRGASESDTHGAHPSVTPHEQSPVPKSHVSSRTGNCETLFFKS